jgi:hypothetical protein
MAKGCCKMDIATRKYAAAQVTAKAAGVANAFARDRLKPRRPYREHSEQEKMTT